MAHLVLMEVLVEREPLDPAVCQVVMGLRDHRVCREQTDLLEPMVVPEQLDHLDLPVEMELTAETEPLDELVQQVLVVLMVSMAIMEPRVKLVLMV
jgi:hypothetical protein